MAKLVMAKLIFSKKFNSDIEQEKNLSKNTKIRIGPLLQLFFNVHGLNVLVQSLK